MYAACRITPLLYALTVPLALTTLPQYAHATRLARPNACNLLVYWLACNCLPVSPLPLLYDHHPTCTLLTLYRNLCKRLLVLPTAAHKCLQRGRPLNMPWAGSQSRQPSRAAPRSVYQAAAPALESPEPRVAGVGQVGCLRKSETHMGRGRGSSSEVEGKSSCGAALEHAPRRIAMLVLTAPAQLACHRACMPAHPIHPASSLQPIKRTCTGTRPMPCCRQRRVSQRGVRMTTRPLAAGYTSVRNQ